MTSNSSQKAMLREYMDARSLNDPAFNIKMKIGKPSDPGSRLRRKLRKQERQNKAKARRKL